MFKKKEELKENANSFIMNYKIPSHRWNKRGILQASINKHEPVTAFKILGYPGLDPD
jgi:hypothetical protein